MKVLVVINVLTHGGAERVVCRLTKEWAKRHDVHIAVFDATQPVYEFGGRIIDLEVPAPTLPRKFSRLFRGSFRLANILRKYRPDRIISFMEGANFIAILGAAMSGFLNRLWVSVRQNPARINLPYLVFMPVLYRLADRVVAPSEGVRDGLAKIGIPSAKLSVIRNPVVFPIPRSTSPSPFPFPYVLGAGKLRRQKGFDLLLKSFRGIGYPDVHLVILGDGPERERLIGLANRLCIGSRVHFPGASSEIERWFHHARCFILPSRYEGWPNVLMEAMAYGCPVVSFDCRYGPSEIFENGNSGILIAQRDVASLRDAISRILTDVEHRDHLVVGGRARGKLFSIDRIAPLWLTDDGT